MTLYRYISMKSFRNFHAHIHTQTHIYIHSYWTVLLSRQEHNRNIVLNKMVLKRISEAKNSQEKYRALKLWEKCTWNGGSLLLTENIYRNMIQSHRILELKIWVEIDFMSKFYNDLSWMDILSLKNFIKNFKKIVKYFFNYKKLEAL